MTNLMLMFATYELAGFVYLLVIAIVEMTFQYRKYGVDRVYDATLIFQGKKEGSSSYNPSASDFHLDVKWLPYNMLFWPVRYTENVIEYGNVIQTICENELSTEKNEA